MTTSMCLPTVYLNGEFMPFENAKISPLDRGFIFGDGVYEVIPYYAGRGLRAVQHLQRLQRSLDELQIENPYPIARWESLIASLVEQNGGGNIAVYIQITRGVAKRDFAPPADITQTVFMMANPLATPKPGIYENGFSCVSLDDNRWLRCQVKATSLLGAVLLKHEGNQAGADDVVLFRDGYLTESSASNIAAVKNGVILCPPMDNLILGGITYELMIELARKHAMPLDVRRIHRREVKKADELWIMSSTKEVVPIVKLDDKPIGTGRPGPVFKQMQKLFDEYKRNLSAAPSLRAAE